MAVLNKKTGSIGGVVASIIAGVIFLEGGYVNNPKDPGGATNYGITEKVAREHDYKGDMKDLPKSTAEQIYYEDYVLKPGFEPLAQLSPAVLEELVDTGVNTGTGRASRWFQETLNHLNRGGTDYPDIKVDGKVGPATMNSYKALVKVRGQVGACELTIKVLDAKQANHYLSLTSLETFTPGWISHRIGNVPLSKCAKKGD